MARITECRCCSRWINDSVHGMCAKCVFGKTEKLMYSIITLLGSSGSPVVNLQCQLVAINYIGLYGIQNFNYGIRVKYLKILIDK